MREIKETLGVRGRTHYKNLKYRTSNFAKPKMLDGKETLFDELFNTGQEIERLKNVIFEMRMERFKKTNSLSDGGEIGG
jgi:hypothetical protein